jgi:hypothetical protein
MQINFCSYLRYMLRPMIPANLPRSVSMPDIAPRSVPSFSHTYKFINSIIFHFFQLSPASSLSQPQQQQSSQSPNMFNNGGSSNNGGTSRQIPIQLVGPFPGQTFAPGPVPPPSFSSSSVPPSYAPPSAHSHRNNLITDPQRYIHTYATQTPVATILEESGHPNPMKMNNGTIGEMLSKGRTTDNFVRELRDQGQ